MEASLGLGGAWKSLFSVWCRGLCCGLWCCCRGLVVSVVAVVGLVGGLLPWSVAVVWWSVAVEVYRRL